MTSALAEVTWLVMLLQEMGIGSLTLVQLHCDNMSAIHFAKNLVFS